MGAMASQITSLTLVNSTVYSDADQRKHQSSASLAFVRGIHRGPVNSPHKAPVTRKIFPFDDVITCYMCALFPGKAIPNIKVMKSSYPGNWSWYLYIETTPSLESILHFFTLWRFELNIFKMESWNYMGRTGNMIIKDFLRQMRVPLENSPYFGDGDGFNSNPKFTLCIFLELISRYKSQLTRTNYAHCSLVFFLWCNAVQLENVLFTVRICIDTRNILSSPDWLAEYVILSRAPEDYNEYVLSD